MTMSRLTYILGFSVNFFFQPIYTDYTNWTYILIKDRHLEWKVELSDIILKWDYPRTIPARFGLTWFSGFRGKDLNVIFYQNISPICIISINRLKEKIHRKTQNIC
jgi:hypothetical protein